jgi:hypothetical protein
VLAVLALGAFTLVGCAPRVHFTPEDLSKVQQTAGVQPLRVYPHRRVWAMYEESAVDTSFEVDRKIIDTSKGRVSERYLTRDAAGLILKIEELNGMPLLWITFDAGCKEVDCSYGFVQSEDGRFRLNSLPERKGYKPPRVYHMFAWDGRRMKQGKLASLAEANEVWLLKKKNGQIRTIVLDVRKQSSDDRSRDRSRERGVD